MSKRNRMSRRHAGFTLMEVLLVMGILLVLGTVSVVAYTKIKANSDKQAAQALVDQVESAVKNYQRVMGVFPEDEEGLGALITRPDDEDLAAKWSTEGPFIEGGKIPKDSWGTELVYKRVAEEDPADGIYFHVYSCGPNRDDDNGTGDDIPNWGEQE